MKRVVLAGVALITLCFPIATHAQENTPMVVNIDTDGDGILDEQDACPTVSGLPDDNPKKNGCTPKILARQWVVNFIEKYAPPGRKVYYDEATETKEEAQERYASLADDLIDTVYDVNTKPIFAGPTGRSQTVSLLLGIMFWETSFRKDVDFGIGEHSRGDHGESWCLMQIKIGDGRTASWNTRLNRVATPMDDPEDVRPGYSGEELVHDRKLCFSEGLKVVRGSFGVCHDLPLAERLSSYASGSCDKGRDASKKRVNTGIRWFYNSQRFFKDEELIDSEKILPIAAKGMLAQTP